MGSPSVTVYRELRRLKNIDSEHAGLLKELEQAGDNGDWKRYVDLMGGVCLKVKDQPLRALMVPKSTESKYHEITQKLLGFVGSAGEVVTRIFEWKIGYSKPCEEQQHQELFFSVFIERRERASLEFCQ